MTEEDNYLRNCPVCNIQIKYSSIYNRKYAERDNKTCLNCRPKQKTGKDSPNYGKSISDEQKEKISKSLKLTFSSGEYFQKRSEYAKKNSWMMKDANIHNFWIEKYGIEEADKRMAAMKEKHSKNATGKNNNMYGKPTPKKAGNGWSGWYKDHFFRSLRELSYILYMEENNIEWKSAENIRIPYVNYDGSERTYSPDFLVEDKKIVEIKPKKLINSPLVKLKTEALAKYCEENDLEYDVIDFEICDFIKLTKLLDNNNLKLTEKTLEKYNTWKMKQNYSS